MPPSLRLAVVLARGLGTRLRERSEAALDRPQEQVAAAGLKAMMPFARPFLDYQLSRLADAGFTRACLVIGPEHGAVREYYDRHPPCRLALAFAVQERARGTADAVLAAEGECGGEEFAVVNGDNLYPVAALRQLSALDGRGLVAFPREALLAGNVPAERVRAFALLALDEGGRLAAIVEKPDEGTARELGDAALVSMGCWRFGPEIFAACRAIAPSSRGELELPDAVLAAMRRGTSFAVARCAEPVLDLARRDDVLRIGRLLASEVAEP